MPIPPNEIANAEAIQEAAARLPNAQVRFRVVCNTDDYVGYRTVLEAQVRVGIRTCHDIANQATLNNLNYHQEFFLALYLRENLHEFGGIAIPESVADYLTAINEELVE